MRWLAVLLGLAVAFSAAQAEWFNGRLAQNPQPAGSVPAAGHKVTYLDSAGCVHAQQSSERIGPSQTCAAVAAFGCVWRLDCAEGRIYSATAGRRDGTQGASLQVWDVTNPSEPVPLGSVDVSRCLSGDVLPVVDVTDPRDPQLIGCCDEPRWTCGDKGGCACVADYWSGPRVIAVADPDAAERRAGCVALAGNFRCVAVDAAALRVVDISDPDAPHEEQSFRSQAEERGIAVAGRFPGTEANLTGLLIVGMESEPAKPEMRRGSLAPAPATIARVGQLPASLLPAFSSPVSTDDWEAMSLAPRPNDVSRLPAGVYFARSAVADRPPAVRRMVLAD